MNPAAFFKRAVYLALLSFGGAFADEPIDCENITAESNLAAIDYCAIHIEATTAVISSEEESTFTGNVKLRRQNQEVSADELNYNAKTQQLSAYGGVYFKSDGADIEADSAVVSAGITNNTSQAQQQSAEFNNAKFQIAQSDPPASGRAKSIHLSSTQQTLSGVRYTTCDPNDPDWELRAEQIEINNTSGQGVADNVTLRIKNVPVLYLPKLPFPATNKRTSGFLPPIFDSSASKGSEFRLPWYWNIHPQVDATLSPSFMTDRGFAGLGEIRYLTEGIGKTDLAESSLNGLWLPSDKTTNSQRYHASWQHQQRWGSDADQWIAMESDINHVSDASYFFDFDNNKQSRQTHLSSRASFIAKHRGSQWQQAFQVSAQRHKTLTATSQQTLPAVAYSLSRHWENGLSWSLSPKWAELKDPRQNLHYQRGVIETTLNWQHSLPLVDSKLEAGYRYHSEDNRSSNIKHDTHLPFASWKITSGAEKDYSAFGHRLELSAAYHFAEYADQTDFSQLDASTKPGLWDDLWLNNRLAGQDRYSDSNDLSWGISNRFSNSRGEDIARFDIGQRLALSNPKMLANNNQQWVSRAQAKLSKRLSVYGEGLYDAETGLWQQASIDARYQPNDQLSAYARWSRPTDASEQFSLASEYQNDAVSLSAEWTRDIENHRSLGGNITATYKACCWSLGLSMRRSTSADPSENAEMTTSWGLQFELRGLGGISQSTPNESYSVRRWLY